MNSAEHDINASKAESEKISWEAAVDLIKNDASMKKLVIDSFFDDPVTSAAARFYNGSEWRAARALISELFGGRYRPQDMRAIDIGAGRGIASYALAMDGWSVTALEPYKSRTAGSLAIRDLIDGFKLEKITIAEDYGESLNFGGGSFDLVYMRQALHHARDLEKFCMEAARVLKPGGVFIAAREHVLSSRDDLRCFLANHPLHKYYGGENAYTLSEYGAAIKKSGIKLIKTLKTYDSDINLFPETRESLMGRLTAKIGFRPPGFIFNLILKAFNMANKVPGRLYTFAGVKHE
jgi:SAM-dependent methyltransferase